MVTSTHQQTISNIGLEIPNSMEILEKHPASVWDDVLLDVDWSIVQPGVLRQFLSGPLDLFPRRQAGELIVVSFPGVWLVELVSLLLSSEVVRVVILVSIILSVVVVRVVIFVSIATSWRWRWGEEYRRESHLNIIIKIRKIMKEGKTDLYLY